MRIHSCSMALMATVVCVSAAAQLAADDAPGVVRMSDRQPATIQQTSFSLFSHSKSGGCADGCGEAAAAECAAQSGACGGCGEAAAAECAVCPQNAAACCPAPVQCAAPAACCDYGAGCAPQSNGAYCGQQCAEGCNTNYGTDGCNSDGCNSAGGGCRCGCCAGNGYGNCEDDKPASLFGHLFGSRLCRRSVCTCDSCEYCGKGCGLTLFDKLCGGGRKGACGQGAPLFGHYQVHYSDNPGYADSRDGQAWAAQGYGMPVTVPTAPVVRYTYNYSHGTPASRLTPLSTYNPATSAQPLYLQSWH